jgi:hypothetical protein
MSALPERFVDGLQLRTAFAANGDARKGQLFRRILSVFDGCKRVLSRVRVGAEKHGSHEESVLD